MTTRYTLRREILFNLAFLAAAALLLALATARLMQRSGLNAGVLAAVVVTAVISFVLLGNYLVERWVLRPLTEIAASATAIAGGETSRRVPETGPAEIVAVASALNALTDQLLHNQARLAENVRSLDETNQRLTETQHELVQAEKMASLGHLAAGVAHEIGNPLGALMGYVSVQKRRGGDAELLDGIEREARRIDRIVRELLDYARPGGGAREEVDVNVSIERVVTLLRAQGWMERVEVDLQLEPGLPPVLGDAHRVDQIFVNLLRNAESAMAGEGRVTVRTRLERFESERPAAVRRADDPPGVNYSHLRRGLPNRPQSARELPADREVIRVEVEDTGPGIGEADLASIFDPFYTTKGPGEGTGLGLAIVAGSVADLGGRIEASSPPGSGATFNLWLPSAIRDT